MKKTTRKKILGILFAGALLSQGNGANAQSQKVNPSGNLYLTGAVSDKPTLVRAEVLFRDLPFNSDAYLVGESQDNKDLYKFRLQALPLRTKNLEGGITGQHIGTNASNPKNELGLTSRVKAQIGKAFVKSDVRYFPSSKDLDGYAILNSSKIFGDCLWKFNASSGNGFVRPGVDYKLTKRFNVGLETKFAGHISDMKESYVGIRGKLTY